MAHDPPGGPPATTPTIEVMRERLRARSEPGRRNDPWRVALAVEGGGMRGVISAGMLLALEQLGLRSTIDLVVGTSAGALASAFFVEGRTLEGSVLFYTDLNDAPFLDRSRLLKMEAALDLDYLVREAAPARGLDLESIGQADIPLYATVTPVDPTNDTRFLHVSGDLDRIASILSATASLPVLAGGAKVIDERGYVDGGLHEQIPWRTAAALGATHVLVLPSRPVSDADELDSLTFVERFTVVPVVRRVHNDHIGDLVATLPKRSSHASWALRAVSNGRATPIDWMEGRGQPRFDIVDLPRDLHLPDRLERSRPVLVDALIAGAEAIIDHAGAGGPDGIAVEQRVVLTHPDATVKDFRASRLSTLLHDRD
ncbi:MAG: patatin-like phospholipase family protein [Actinomycetota bacterium]